MKQSEYMVFVLGYDLLQEKLTSLDDCPCDWAYEKCKEIYNTFLKSDENIPTKSEYECLRKWIVINSGKIDCMLGIIADK